MSGQHRWGIAAGRELAATHNVLGYPSEEFECGETTVLVTMVARNEGK
jgi:hypothetical protein